MQTGRDGALPEEPLARADDDWEGPDPELVDEIVFGQRLDEALLPMTTMLGLDAPGPPDASAIREIPIPTPADGWVLIGVEAFGLNRSELHTQPADPSRPRPDHTP